MMFQKCGQLVEIKHKTPNELNKNKLVVLEIK